MAAWQFGSLGRGDGDDLSGMDLFAGVADEHIAAVAAGCQAFVARLGEPVLLVEGPQNAPPPQGAYLMPRVEALGTAMPHAASRRRSRRSDT